MNIFWSIIAALLIVGLFVGSYYAGKYPWVKYLMLSILGVVFLGFSTYCATDLNYYYTAEGGIYGVLNGLFDVNVVEGEDLEFSLKNIQLKQVEDDTYSASIKLDRTISFENEKSYIICVNGIPCTTSEVNQNYAQGSYQYTFYDKDLNVKLEDSLKFNFAFYPNYTTLNITTNGGTEAVENWNSYFNKNNFVVTIEETIFTESEIVEGDVSQYRKITYYVDNEVFYSTYFDSTKPIDFTSKTPIKEDHAFLGWSLDGENVVENLSAKSDVKVYAILKTQDVIFTGEKTLSNGNWSPSWTIDLNDYFDIYFPEKEVEIALDVIVETKYGDQASALDFKIKSGQSVEFPCTYELDFTVKVSIDGQVIKINPSDYSDVYVYCVNIMQIYYI